MGSVLDPLVRLALALNSSPGAYAVLLGSGISVAAGVPTGQQVITDLISKVAALEGASTGRDPIGWYRDRFGEEPDYSKLLVELASSPTERNELLRRYFEPASHRPLQPGLRAPTTAHRALAQLAAQGYVSVFLTTNFDRLLEHALAAAGVEPVVLSTPDSLEGTVPLGRVRCTVVKLNGDYLDIRIKNTPDELATYHPAVDRLLDRVLDEYGLIVCGWSADWDTALCRALERSSPRHYTTFWASRSPPTGKAAGLVAGRNAQVVLISSADALFGELAAKVAALDGHGGDKPARTAQSKYGLPARATSFIGRRAELTEIERRLKRRSARLLTLVGPGGTGKTSLAVQAAANVASRFPDGVAFVDLSSARDTAAVLVAITRALGLGEVIERPLGDTIIEHLRARDMLLVLDNFEQVIEAADLVAQLLVECPSLCILVTSREPLHLQGEQLYPVPPLIVPSAEIRSASARQLGRYEAVQLFVNRAQAVRPDFQLTDDNAAIVADICRRLDGLPLAIELAATRLRLFSPHALRDQLRERLKHLSSGPRDLPERQRTLRATIDWSYDLLNVEEQRLFELLSVFSGADIMAIEAIAAQVAGNGDAPDVLDRVAGLAEKSMIFQADMPDGQPRFAMLETMREYASTRLGQSADLAARARRAHAGYFANWVGRLQPDLTGGRRAELLTVMAADFANLLTAWEYWVAAGDLPQLEKLADGLLTLAEARGWYLAIVDLTTDMLAVLKAASPGRIEQEIALRTSLVRALLAIKGFTLEVEQAFAQSVDLFERGSDTDRYFPAIRGLSYLYALRGDLINAARTGRKLLELAERENNPEMLIEANLRVGASKVFVDDPQAGLAHLDRAVSLFSAVPRQAFASRAAGNDPRVACHTTAAFALWLLGRPDRAVERASAALDLAVELDHPFSLAYARFHAGLLHLWRRDFETVLVLAAAAREVADQHDFQIWNATGTVLSGAAQVGLGRTDEGLSDVRKGMALYQGLRSPPVFWPILLWVQAGALLGAGRPAEGLSTLETGLEIMSADPGTTLLPELQLLKGDLLTALAAERRREDPDAGQWYRLAFEGAGKLNIRISQLRAATRLCRTAKGKGEQDAAREELADLYATFTEGSDTSDLREARHALDADKLN